MTSKTENVLTMALCISKKARNPGKTVPATNPAFDLVMTSYDL